MEYGIQNGGCPIEELGRGPLGMQHMYTHVEISSYIYICLSLLLSYVDSEQKGGVLCDSAIRLVLFQCQREKEEKERGRERERERERE